MVEQKQQPPPLPGQNAGWYSRNWKWFIPALCVVAFVCTAISFACVMVMVSLGMKSLGAYKIAVQRAEADPKVTAAIGTPAKEGWFIGGSFNVNGASGNAELAIPLSGPRGEGDDLRCSDGISGRMDIFSSCVPAGWLGRENQPPR